MTDSVIHALDPRTKLFGTMIFIISLFIADSPIGYGLSAVALVLTVLLCRVPVRFILRGMKAIAVLLLLTVVFNIFLTPGEVIWSAWKFHITKEGVFIALQMMLRLSFLIIGSSIMTLTTTPNNLTDGLETSLGFLKKVRVPVHEISMMMSIALRFIPILMEETDKIMKAQMARGADFESGNLVKRAKALIPLLVPLFVSAFRRAGDLAMAMESRCYRGGEGRTKMKPLKYASRDVVAYIVIFLFFTASITVKVIF